MGKIVYVTGNYGKYISVKEQFVDKKIDIDFFEYDFNEPDINDIEKVSRAKVLEVYSILGKPCFVTDSGFYIDEYPNNPGYPGAFVKRSGISSNIDELLETMKDVKNRTCRFVDCLTFYDGTEFYTFYGVSKGILSFEQQGNQIKKAKSNLWYVFVPENHSKTLAEMSDEERKNRNDKHTSATKAFAEWYKNEYSKTPKIVSPKTQLWNSNIERNIRYIDCDGVILDTETGLFDEYNKLKQLDPTLKRLAYLQQLNWQEWLRQAKIIGDAIEILKQQNPNDASILTKVHSLAEGLAKIQYFRKLKLKNNIILVPNDLNKSCIVQAYGHILVDDSIRNLDDWNSNGGIPLFFNQHGKNTDTFNEQHTTNESYPLITSLESVFSKEIDEYCKRMVLKR